MSEQINFPNGFTSWYETHHEIVSSVYWHVENGKNSIAAQIQSDKGRGGLYELAKELTDQFEEEYKDETWEETDWFETLEEFLKDKI